MSVPRPDGGRLRRAAHGRTRRNARVRRRVAMGAAVRKSGSAAIVRNRDERRDQGRARSSTHRPTSERTEEQCQARNVGHVPTDLRSEGNWISVSRPHSSAFVAGNHAPLIGECAATWGRGANRKWRDLQPLPVLQAATFSCSPFDTFPGRGRRYQTHGGSRMSLAIQIAIHKKERV